MCLTTMTEVSVAQVVKAGAQRDRRGEVGLWVVYA